MMKLKALLLCVIAFAGSLSLAGTAKVQVDLDQGRTELRDILGETFAENFEGEKPSRFDELAHALMLFRENPRFEQHDNEYIKALAYAMWAENRTSVFTAENIVSTWMKNTLRSRTVILSALKIYREFIANDHLPSDSATLRAAVRSSLMIYRSSTVQYSLDQWSSEGHNLFTMGMPPINLGLLSPRRSRATN